MRAIAGMARSYQGTRRIEANRGRSPLLRDLMHRRSGLRPRWIPGGSEP